MVIKICKSIITVLCNVCSDIGTNMFFDLVRVYANINPGILYGIINNNSLKLVATVICKAPNNNPDVIINTIL